MLGISTRNMGFEEWPSSIILGVSPSTSMLSFGIGTVLWNGGKRAAAAQTQDHRIARKMLSN
eukprot:6473381-Amphidinium_carterae.3